MSSMEEVEAAEAKMNAAKDALLDYVEKEKPSTATIIAVWSSA